MKKYRICDSTVKHYIILFHLIKEYPGLGFSRENSTTLVKNENTIVNRLANDIQFKEFVKNMPPLKCLKILKLVLCLLICFLIVSIGNDEEINKLLLEVTINQGGVLPNKQAVFLPEQTEKVVLSYWNMTLFRRSKINQQSSPKFTNNQHK